MDETEKRHELQLLLLREGFTQDDARESAARTDRLDEFLEMLRKNAVQFPERPERQILPVGTLDLADVKTKREDAISEAEEAEYYENRDKLATMMAQSFSLPSMPLAVVQALLDVLEANGINRLAAMADIIKTVEGLRKIYEHQIKEPTT